LRRRKAQLDAAAEDDEFGVELRNAGEVLGRQIFETGAIPGDARAARADQHAVFQAVGIDAQMRSMDRSLWETRVRQGRDFDATAHQFGANGGVAAMLDPRYYVPTDANAMYAPAWQLWYRDRANANAEEPPESTKNQLALYDKLKATSDASGQREVMKQILQGAADNFYVFGISLPPDGYGVVKNNMKNVTKIMPNSFGWPTPAPTMPEQFYKA
jgi:peptide/nickel transport system substrate-binding protein